jgi:hypothetical protein
MARRRNRDHAKEYQRRLERGKKRGLSRSQSRGHPRKREKPISAKVKSPLKDDRMARAVALLHRGSSLSKSASEAGVSPERLRKFVRDSHIATRRRGRWKVNLKKLNWEVVLYTRGREELVTLNNPHAVSLAMSFMSRVGLFERTGDASVLSDYGGKSVTDVKGVVHPFETNPNRLYRISHARTERPDKYYRPFLRSR